MEKWSRTIAHFAPAEVAGAEEADRHYRNAHFPFAVRMLQAQPQIVSYHAARACAQYAIDSSWQQAPSAFRYTSIRFEPGRALELDAATAAAIVDDHLVFLRELRTFVVDEQVVVERFVGAGAGVKYLFEYDRPAGESVDAATEVVEKQLAQLAELARDVLGLRHVTANHVRAERATEAVREPGQRPLGVLQDTERQLILEVVFDNDIWACEWFARPEVRAALINGYWALARGHRLDETCGFDRRWPARVPA